MGRKTIKVHLKYSKDAYETQHDALIELSRKTRPSEIPSAEATKQFIFSQFFSTQFYNLGEVGRFKVDKKLALANRLVGLTAAEDIKDKKTAEEMAKKVYLAFQKERSMHQFDNEQNKNTIEVLKNMNKKLNEQVTTADNDPRVTKLDDEFYTLWRLEQSYKKDKSDASKKNLTRYYVAKLAVLNPSINANTIMDVFTKAPLKSNTM